MSVTSLLEPGKKTQGLTEEVGSRKKPIKVRARGKTELMDRIGAKLKAIKPKAGTGEKGTFEVTRTCDQVLSRVKYGVSTGVDPFDDLTGYLPVGRATEIFGLDACGKTAMVIRAAGRARQGQIFEISRDELTGFRKYVKLSPSKIDVTVLYIDNEQSLEDDEKIVVDGEDLDILLGRCDTVGQMFKLIERTVDMVTEEQKAEDKKAKDEKRDPVIYFVIIVVDTIAATSSKEELTRSWDDNQDYNRQPKQLREGFRKLTRKINRANVALICTNQVSDKVGDTAMKGKKPRSNVAAQSDYSAFGGKALRYYASLRIFMSQVSDKYIMAKGQRFSSGYVVQAYTAKNRQIKPLRSVRLVILFDSGYSRIFSILETMLHLKVAVYNPDNQRISFKFSANGITGMDTSTAADLESEDDDESRVKNPSISNRAEWPMFYERNKISVEALYKESIRVMFSSDAEVIDELDVLDDDEDGEDDD